MEQSGSGKSGGNILTKLTPLQQTIAAVTVVSVSAFIVFKLLVGGKKSRKTALDSTQFLAFPLKEKIVINHDTRIFRFALPTPESTLGLPTGQHMSLKADIDGSPVQRTYTPITGDETKGHVDVLVKVYFANVHPKFPEGGKMTQHLDKMKIGDFIHIKGPTGRFTYKGRGELVVKKGQAFETKNLTTIGMIAGGSGITPMLQLIRNIQRDPSDKTQMTLLFANQTEEDILLREELEECTRHPTNPLKLWYTLDRPKDNWKYSSGFISEDMLREHMVKPCGDDGIVVMCGPPPMINFACKPNLEKLGWKPEQMLAY